MTQKVKKLIATQDPQIGKVKGKIVEESVTCIAMKDYRHQNIMGSVDVKQKVKELWAFERVTKFIDALG